MKRGMLVLLVVSLFLVVGSVSADDIDTIILKETQGISRSYEYVHNGFPLGVEDNIFSTNGLGIRDENGIRIQADFEVLSRWGGGQDDITKPIQWLLLTFPVTLNANQQKIYTLVSNDNLVNSVTLNIVENPTNFVVNTGNALFSINKNSPFINSASIKTSLGIYEQIITGNPYSYVSVEGEGKYPALAPDSVTVEKSNSLFATIKVEGFYDTPFFGVDEAQRIRYVTRFNFYANSSTVKLSHYYAWPGRYCDIRNSCSNWDGLILDGMGIDFETNINSNVRGHSLVSDSIYYNSAISDFDRISLSQKLRPELISLAEFELDFIGSITNGQYAKQPVLAINDNLKGVAVSIDKMYYKEPQAMSIFGNGTVNLRLIDNKTRLGQHMGNSIDFSIVLTGDSNVIDESYLREKVYAPLHNPIFAFPTNSRLKDSLVLDEVVDLSNLSNSPYSGLIDNYNSIVGKITDTSFEFIENARSFLSVGGSYSNYNFPTHGMMTYGYYPRLFGPSKEAITVDLGASQRWDDYYMEGKFTDYHSAFQNVFMYSMLNQNPDTLVYLSFPAAKRMAYTQVTQCNLDSTYFACGWGLAGYRQYRSDANSQHSYLENLYSYYYATGDRNVLDILELGIDRFQSLNSIGRQDTHAYYALLFLGKTLDKSYLNDLDNALNQAFTNHIIILSNNDLNFSFLMKSDISSNPGVAKTEQAWMGTLYFSNFMQKYLHEFGNKLFNNIYITDFIDGYGLSLYTYNRNTAPSSGQGCSGGSDGTASGRWSRDLIVSWSGSNIGGQIVDVVHDGTPSEECLFTTGKALVSSTILRAAKNTNNLDLFNMGLDLVNVALETTSNEPWEKETSENYIRMHHSIALIEEGFNSSLVSVPSSPIISLSSNVSSGVAPLSVLFSALASDSDGTIAKYEWDLDGDNIYELDSGLASTTFYTYDFVGSYNVKVRVTDNSSLTSIDSVLITVINPIFQNNLINITLISRGDVWKYFKGVVQPSSNWADITFDDSSWFSGATGIGYGDGDDATILSDMQYNYLTIYARKMFNIDDVSLIEGLDFNIAYDDGFVAYLNGVEVARESMPSGTPSFDTASTGHEVGIPSFYNLTSQVNNLVDGVNVLAVEVHNSDLGSSDLSFIPELNIVVREVQTYHIADTTQDGCVDLTEADAFVARWKNEDADVTISDIISMLAEYKKGC